MMLREEELSRHMKHSRKRIASLLLVGVLAAALSGCSTKRTAPPGALSGTVTLSGSTALLHIAQAAKELYEEQHEFVSVNVSGGGSFNGLNQVSTGAVQVGNSDVEAPPDKYPGLVEFRVGISPFIIVANKDVTVDDVTMDQLARILRGEVTNWKAVGGADQLITVISRQASSGSRATIVQTVLKNQGDITKDAVIQDSNGKVRDGVVSTPGAIGYVDAPYYDPAKMKALKVNGVAYTKDAVISGQYTIFSYGRMYTKGQPTGLTKEFLDFVLGKEFQEQYVEKLGFIPVTQMAK
jgi:phosphate transport system substrate-binding protein